MKKEIVDVCTQPIEKLMCYFSALDLGTQEGLNGVPVASAVIG